MRVFVVEDSAIVRRLIVRRLELIRGIQVVGEATGQRQAFTLIRNTRPEVVLVDLTLDSGTGLGLVSDLRDVGFPGHIVVLTAMSIEPLREACLNAGADACYEKGTGMETLFDMLEVQVRRASHWDVTAESREAACEGAATVP